MKYDFDIAIIGGGPGGYVAAIRAAQLGQKTVIIEREKLGGLCLNWGCIPTKAIIHSAELYSNLKHEALESGVTFEKLSFDYKKVIERSRDISSKISKNIELLIKKNKIDHISGTAKFIDRNTVSVKVEGRESVQNIKAKNIVIATGANNISIPGLEVDGKNIISSYHALKETVLPGSIVIVGAGAIGIEFAYIYNAFGVSVTIVEAFPSILPLEDKEISEFLHKHLVKSGIKILTSTKLKSYVQKDGKLAASIENGSKSEISTDKILVAVGVTGNTKNLNLDAIGLEIQNGFIKVDRSNYRTNISNIYAVGDVVGAPCLAHVASAEGVTCIESIVGVKTKKVDYNKIPSAVYCNPQVASIGLTEEKARTNGYDIKIGKFPYMASGKAFANGERSGFVKLIFDKKYDELIGAHIIGANASELLGELSVAFSHEATSESVMRTIHAHPTLSEMIMEASANANGESIHI